MVRKVCKSKKPFNKKASKLRPVCDRERIRTSDRLLRRQMLYPAELRDLKVTMNLSGWQDSNLRPPAPKAGAITGLRYTPTKSLKVCLNFKSVLFSINI